MRDDETLRRFLLGELEEDEAERVEGRLLADHELFELCGAIEAELLDACAWGELASAERERILERLASSPQGRVRFALTKDLTDLSKTTTIPQMPAPVPFRRPAPITSHPAFRWAMAATLVALLGLGGTWVLVHEADDSGQEKVQTADHEPAPSSGPSRNGVSQKIPAPPVGSPVTDTPPDREPAAPPQVPDQVAEEKKPKPPAVREAEPAVFQLSLLTLRDETRPQEIRIPGEAKRVNFRVDVTGEVFESYSAVVRGSKGEPWKESRIEPTPMDGGSVLILDLPADKLLPGKYEVEIHGNSAEGTPELLMLREIEVSRGE